MSTVLAEESEAEAAGASPPAVDQGRFSRNFLASLVNFAATVLIGIWYVPFLIRHIGTAAYGLVPLALNMTSYVALITLGLNAAVGRFITIALAQGDDVEARRIFNTSLVGILALAAVLLGPTVWIALHVDHLIRIPSGYERQARWLFLATVGAFLLNEIKTPFDVASFCRNRLDLRSLVNTGDQVTRVALVALLFAVAVPRLWFVGLGILAGAVVSTLGAIRLWRTLTPALQISLRDFDWPTLKSLTDSGFWIAIGQVGTLLFLSIDLLVVNRLFGAETAGRYAAVMQWSTLLRVLGGTVAAVFAPTIIRLYAQREIEGLVKYVRQSVKLTSLLMALPISLVCGLSRPLLLVWLGPKFVPLAPLMSLMTIHLCVNLGFMPVTNVSMATNSVRVMGIMQVVFGVCNLGLALFLAGPMHWNVYGVAAAGAIVLTAKNVVFTSMYGAYLLGRRLTTFLWEAVPVIFLTLATAGACKLVALFWQIHNFTSLVLAGAAISLVFLAAAYLLVLSPAERAVAVGMASRFRRTRA